MSKNERLFIRACIEEMTAQMRRENPRLAPGEIYDAIAQELERRCRAVINNQSQENTRHSGLASLAEDQEQ